MNSGIKATIYTTVYHGWDGGGAGRGLRGRGYRQVYMHQMCVCMYIYDSLHVQHRN